MPYSRPGTVQEVVATKVSTHGLPAIETGIAGVAVKQTAPAIGTALSTRKTIAIGETFAIIYKGEVEVASVGASVRGDDIYITAATNVLTATAAGNVPFGRVVKVAGNQGTPTGRQRIDLDAKGAAT